MCTVRRKILNNDLLCEGEPMDRLEIKTKNLDILADYRAGLRMEPQLRTFFLELTLRCNEACFHCGSGCSSSMPDGLPIEKYKEVLMDIKENFGTKVFIAVTGGEPLLYDKFFELMKFISDEGFRWGMTSNATLITPEIARRLADVGMRTISVSVDGTKELHDSYRNMPDAYDLAIRGIQNLIDVDAFSSIMVTTVINHENIAYLDEMYDTICAMDINEWRLTGLEPIGRALDHPDKLLTIDDQRKMFDFIKSKRDLKIPVTYGCTHFVGLEYEAEIRDWYFLCNAGVYTASINVNGEFGGCLDIPRNEKTICGNISSEKFSDVWRNGFEFFRTPLSTRCETCKNCPDEKWCSGDAYHSWNYEKDEPRVCLRELWATDNM